MKQHFIAKAKASFKTKLMMFLYEHTLSPENGDLSLDSFNDFEITSPLVIEYTTQYWQKKYGERIREKMSVKEIAGKIAIILKTKKDELKSWEKHYVNQVFPKLFDFNDFATLKSKEECHYCGISQRQIDLLAGNGLINKKTERGWTMEVDRFNSNFEYKISNAVMCCYWCNNAKTDEFTPDEFNLIAQGIRKVWQDRLSQIPAAPDPLDRSIGIERFQDKFGRGVEGIEITKATEHPDLL